MQASQRFFCLLLPYAPKGSKRHRSGVTRLVLQTLLASEPSPWLTFDVSGVQYAHISLENHSVWDKSRVLGETRDRCGGRNKVSEGEGFETRLVRLFCAANIVIHILRNIYKIRGGIRIKLEVEG